MRVGRQAVAAGLLAEVVELLLGDPAVEEGAGVDAGGGVALEEDLVAAVALVLAPEEVVEAHVVEGGGGGEGRDVAADTDAGSWARETMTAAFQRVALRTLRSISSLPGKKGSSLVAIVLT